VSAMTPVDDGDIVRNLVTNDQVCQCGVCSSREYPAHDGDGLLPINDADCPGTFHRTLLTSNMRQAPSLIGFPGIFYRGYCIWKTKDTRRQAPWSSDQSRRVRSPYVYSPMVSYADDVLRRNRYFQCLRIQEVFAQVY
jgi:hypothetical protein